MSWVAVAVGGAAVISGIMGSNASKSAAETQAGAAQNAAQIGKDEFNTITAQEQPFMQSGYGAQGQLNYLLGIGPNGSQPAPATADNWGATSPIGSFTNPRGSAPGSWLNTGATAGTNMRIPIGETPGVVPGGMPQTSSGLPTAASSPAGGYGSLLTPFTAENFRQLSPAYQFQLQQGQQGVLNGAESSQGALSGSAMKDLVDYNQGLANTSFNTAFNQYQTQQGNIYSRLSDIANRGQNAAANTGQQGTALAGSVAQSVTNAGTAQAAGQIGSANAWGSALGGLSSLPYLMGRGGGGDPGFGQALGEGLNFGG